MDEPVAQYAADPQSSASYMRNLCERVLNNDPEARQELDNIAHFVSIEAFVAETKHSSLLHEHRFSSSLPLLGKPIAAARSAIYSIASRWAVRTVIAQQSRFNASAAHALQEAVDLNHRLMARLQAIEARVTHLERERESR